MNADIKQIVTRYSAMTIDNYIFFQPNIPPKKLSSALKAYARDVEPEAVLALVDNTARGNAKDGAVLTDTRLYAHNMWEKPVSIELSAIGSISFKEGLMSSKLLINESPFLDVNFPEKGAMRLFTRMLEEIITTLHPTAAGIAPAKALKELKELLDAGIITSEALKDPETAVANAAAEALRALDAPIEEPEIKQEVQVKEVKEVVVPTKTKVILAALALIVTFVCGALPLIQVAGLIVGAMTLPDEAIPTLVIVLLLIAWRVGYTRFVKGYTDKS